MFLGQVEVENLFDLFGEFGRDFRFSAAQEIGGGFLEDALFVPNAFVSAGGGRELGAGSGKEKFKQGEKVGHAVLDRGAGEQDPAVRGEGGHGLGVLGLAVFEVLGFVSDHAEQGNRFKEFEVANEGAVRGDDEVGFAKGSRFLVRSGPW